LRFEGRNGGFRLCQGCGGTLGDRKVGINCQKLERAAGCSERAAAALIGSRASAVGASGVGSGSCETKRGTHSLSFPDRRRPMPDCRIRSSLLHGGPFWDTISHLQGQDPTLFDTAKLLI
jgi:hypothetical protein